MKIYCSSCGASNSYTSTKPNFCQKCGQSFTQATASSVNPPASETEEDVDAVPSLNKLDFDIVGNAPVKGIPLGTLSQISAPEAGSHQAEGPKKKVPKISKKKVLEQFQKEAGAIRPENG